MEKEEEEEEEILALQRNPSFASRYRIEGRIGGGVYSTVWKLVSRSFLLNQQLDEQKKNDAKAKVSTSWALKVASVRQVSAGWQQLGLHYSTIREMSVLCHSSRHSHVLRCIECWISSTFVAWVLPLFPETLSSWLARPSSLSKCEWSCLDIFRQILEGLAFLHSNMHMVHRDLRADNILVSEDRKHSVIADFGLSRVILEEATDDHHNPHHDTTHVCNQLLLDHTPQMQTKQGMAPEVQGELGPMTYSSLCDVWSVGILALRCLFQKMTTDTQEQCVTWIVEQCRSGSSSSWDRLFCDFVYFTRKLPLPPRFVNWAETKLGRADRIGLFQLACRCLQKTPKQRPTCDELLVHPPFSAPLAQSISPSASPRMVLAPREIRAVLNKKHEFQQVMRKVGYLAITIPEAELVTIAASLMDLAVVLPSLRRHHPLPPFCRHTSRLEKLVLLLIACKLLLKPRDQFFISRFKGEGDIENVIGKIEPKLLLQLEQRGHVLGEIAFKAIFLWANLPVE